MTDISKTRKNEILIDENGVISLNSDYNGYESETNSYDEQEDLSNLKLLISSSNNLKLEIKYPSLEKLRLMDLPTRRGFLKTVNMRVKPIKRMPREETSLCEQVLGVFPNLAYDRSSDDYKIIIQGFLPQKFTFKHSEQLKIGDMLISINDIPINSKNIEALLSALKRPQTIQLVVLAPITYVNMNTTNIIKNPLISHDVESMNTSSTQKKKTCNKIIANSKSTQVLQGDRVKCPTESLFEDFAYFVMILSLDKETAQQSSDMDDLVYRFPNTSGELNRQNIGLNDLIITIRGMFMTLALSIKEFDQNKNEAICCLIEHQYQLLNVCFLNLGFSKSGVLVLVVPNDQIRLDYLKVFATNLNSTLQFTFGDLFLKKGTECVRRRINSSVRTKQQLDTFFSHLKHRFLSRNAKTKAQDKSVNKKRCNFLNTIKSKFINSIPFFDLPVDLKCDLDATLSDIEAQEFIDLENNYYKNRRQFIISGSVLFYKDYLVSTHLSKSLTERVHEYCEHYGLFNMVRNGSTNQFHIWKEIFVDCLDTENRADKSRHFLIISGLKEFLYAIILETGGIISRQIERKQLIEPDPFYIQQATFILTDIHDNGIMSEIEHCFKQGFGTKEGQVNINRFVTNKKKTPTVKTRSNSKSRSPMRLSNILSLRGKGSDEKKGPVNSTNSAVEIKGPGTSDIYHFHKEQRHMSPSASLGHQRDCDGQHHNRDEKRFFNDISLQESIIYYAQSDTSQEGIFFPPPKQFDFNSNLFVRVFSHFVQSCFKIKNLFEKTIIESDSKDSLLEQGVLFNMTVDEQKSDNSQSKPKEITFWVVGRRKMHRSDLSSNQWSVVKDFYVCFNDSIDQVLLELAFDVGFGKLTI